MSLWQAANDTPASLKPRRVAPIRGSRRCGARIGLVPDDARSAEMLNKISQAQQSMLQAAAKRDDCLLTPPAKARAAAVVTLATKLIDAGWVKEIKAGNGAPVWRKDATGGQIYSLKLTPKGLKAAAAMIATADGDKATPVSATPGDAVQRASAQRPASPRQTSGPAHEELRSEDSLTAIRAPRACAWAPW